MNKTYLVTGAAGHLGGVIVQKLIKANKNVRALVLEGEKNLPEGAQIFYGDVRDINSLKFCFENIDGELIVIHCAGIVSIASKFNQAVYDVNVNGTKNIVDLCKKYSVKKLVYVSSVHAIPEKPTGEVISEISEFDADKVVGLYAKTKAQATSYVLQQAKEGLNATVVHPSGITGPYDNGRGHLTTLVIDFYKRKLTSGIKGGYDFVDVRDVANGIISACEKGKQGECYILSNKYFKVSEILELLHEITGKRKVRHILPLWFAKLTAPLAELYYKILKQPPLFTAYSIYTLNSNALFSHEKADNELNYSTRQMKDTLKDTVSYLKQVGRI